MAAWASQGAKPRRQLLPRSFWKELAPRTARLQSSDWTSGPERCQRLNGGCFRPASPCSLVPTAPETGLVGGTASHAGPPMMHALFACLFGAFTVL